MFRIRESFLDEDSVYLWFDGRLGDEGLESARHSVNKYLSQNKVITVDLSNVDYIGWFSKRYLKEIKDQVSFVGMSDHLKFLI